MRKISPIPFLLSYCLYSSMPEEPSDTFGNCISSKKELVCPKTALYVSIAVDDAPDIDDDKAALSADPPPFDHVWVVSIPPSNQYYYQIADAGAFLTYLSSHQQPNLQGTRYENFSGSLQDVSLSSLLENLLTPQDVNADTPILASGLVRAILNNSFYSGTQTSILLPYYVLPTATTVTWSGTTNNDMSIGSNWFGGTAPVSGDGLIFTTNGTTTTPNNTFSGYVLSQSGNAISITNPTSPTATYTLSGNGFTVSGSALVTATGAFINTPFALNGGNLSLNGGTYGGAISDSGGGTLTISGDTTFSVGNTLSSTNLVASGALSLTSGTTSVGPISGSGPIRIAPSTTLITNVSSSITSSTLFALPIAPPAGSPSFTVTGGGVLSVSGNNTYSTAANPLNISVTGNTTLTGASQNAFGISNANLSIASGSTLNTGNFTLTLGSLSGSGSFQIGTGAVTLTNGGTTFSGSIPSGTGGITYSGANTLTLSGTNSYTGTTTISGGGTLAVSNLSGAVSFITLGGTLAFSSAATFAQGITLSPTIGTNAAIDLQGNSVTISGTIGGSGGLTLKNSGGGATLTLQPSGAANNYTGGTYLQAGTLLLNSANAFPSSGAGTPLSISTNATLNMNNNSITVSTLTGQTGSAIQLGSGTLTVKGGTTGSSSNYSGSISGTGSLIFSGNGTTLLLTGTNTYSGATTINLGGTLGVTNSGLSPNTSSIIFADSGGTLLANTALTSSRPITLNGSGTINTGTFTSTFTGTISGSSNFTTAGSGILILSPASSNSYSGETIIQGGTLRAGNSNSPFGSTTVINVQPTGILDLNNFNVSITQLTGDPGAKVFLGSAALTITGGVDITPFYGVISETGDVVLDGGSPTFMGINTYTGTSTVQGGATWNTLGLGSSSSLIFDTGGGTIQLGSTTSSSATLEINADATFATNTFNLTLNGDISQSGPGFSLTKIGQGTLTLGASTNDFTGDIFLEGGTLNVTADSLGAPAAITFQQFCGTLQFAEAFTTNTPITLNTTGLFDTNGNNITLSGNLTNDTGYGGITKVGTGNLTLTGTNTYAGMTTLTAGTLIASSISLPLPTSSPIFTPMMVFNASGTTSPIFQASSTFTKFPSVVFLSNGTINTNGNNITINSVVAGQYLANTTTPITFTKSGSGILTLSGANIYIGNTAITGGTLQAGVATVGTTSGAFGVGSAVTVSSGATLALNNFNNTIGSLSGVSGSAITLGSATLTINNGLSLSFGGNISGTGGGLTLSTGTLTLSGQNTYTGATTIASGATLQILNSSNTDIGSVSNSGTLSTNNLVEVTSYTQAANSTLGLDFTTLSDYGHITSTGAININTTGTTLNITNSGHVAPSGTVTLLEGTSITNNGFTTINNPFSKATIQYTATQLNLLFSSSGCQATWDLDSATGNWGVTGNWDPACYPGTNPATDEDSATFISLTEPAIEITLATNSTPLTTLTLHTINFNSADTDFTIIQQTGSSTTITMDGAASSNPTIAVSAGNHSLEAQIQYNQNGTISLTGGQLTLPSDSTLSGTNTLTISGSSGTLVNQSFMTPNTIIMTGGTVTNSRSFSPSNAFSMSGGTLVNQTLGFLGTSIPSNLTISLSNGEISNSGTIYAESINISGGEFTHSLDANLALCTLSLTGGTLTTQKPMNLTPIPAPTAEYTQGSAGSLVLDIPSSSTGSDYGQIICTSGNVNLNGSLTLTNTGGAPQPSGGQLTLLTGSSIIGTFTSVDTSIFSSASLVYGATSVYLDFTGSNVCSGIWKSPVSGNWGTLANWQGCVPGLTSSTLDTATFPNISGGASTMTIPLADPPSNPIIVSLHQISLASGLTSYTIAQTGGQGSIILLGTSPASINVSQGTHTINAPISLQQNAALNFSGGSSLTFGSAMHMTVASGSLSFTLQGTSGTLTNQGTLSPTTLAITAGTLNNTNTISAAGGVSVSAGTLANTGTVNIGPLSLSGGTISTTKPMNVSTTYTQTGGTLTLDFPSLSPHGQIIASGALSLGGTLNITNSGSVSPSGQVNLLQGSSLTGTFNTVNNAFPDAKLRYSTLTNRVYLNFGGCHGIWNSPSVSNDFWGLATNWSSSCIPGSNAASFEDTATFNDVTGAPANMTIVLATSDGSSVQTLVALYELNFSALNTSFTLNQFTGGLGSLPMNANEGNASVTITGGTHTLNIPLVLSVDTDLQLTEGTLTFGSAAAVTGSQNFIINGSGGTWTNQATIHPTTVSIESGIINNSGTISPTTLSINGAASSTLTLTNYNTISPTGAVTIDNVGTTNIENFLTFSSGTTLTIGATGSPTILSTNSFSAGSSLSIQGGEIINTLGGHFFSGTGFTISGGTISNSLAGTMYATPGQTFTISGGTITNEDFSAMGSESISDLASTLIISGGTIANTTAYMLGAAVQVSGGTITNNEGGQFFSKGGSFTISGGSITNDATSVVAASAGNMILSGGSLISSGDITTVNYTQSGSGTLQLNVVNPTSLGNVAASGSASLGGTLIVEALPAFSMTAGQTADLLTFTSYDNSLFSNVLFQNFPSSFVASIHYLPLAVELEIAAAVPTHVHGANTQIILSSINQHNSFITEKAYQMRKRMSFSRASQDVASVSNNYLAQNAPSTEKISQLHQRIEKEIPWSVYTGPLASFGSVNSSGTQVGVGYSSIGGLVGFDYVIPKDISLQYRIGLGTIVEFREKDITARENSGSAIIDKAHISFYTTIVPNTLPDLAFDLICGYAHTWDRIKRHAGNNKQFTAFGNNEQNIFDALLDMEYTFSNRRYAIPQWISITPLVNVQYILDCIGGYKEHGANIYDLQMQSKNIHSLTSNLGTRVDFLYQGEDFVIRCELDANWQYQYLNLNQTFLFTPYNFSSNQTSLTTVAPGRSSLILGADILATLDSGWQVEAFATYQLNNLFYDTFFYLGFGKEF